MRIDDDDLCPCGPGQADQTRRWVDDGASSDDQQNLALAAGPLRLRPSIGRQRLAEPYDRRAKLIAALWTVAERRRACQINRFIELGSMEAIKELVKIGMGVGILAPWIVRKELESHSLVSLPLGRTKLKRRWGISYQKGRKLNLIEETFVGLCESAIENMILENVITELP